MASELPQGRPEVPRPELDHDPDELAQVRQLGPWFHNLHLPSGAQTAPDHPYGDFPSFKWRRLARYLPEDLTGWRALDIGCNAGFYSFELARRGADVTGIDRDDLYLAQARWAASHFAELPGRVTFRKQHIYDLVDDPAEYDLVLFMGVFYHLRYPMLGLDIVAQKVRRLMVFQTLTMPGSSVVTHTNNRRFGDRDEMLRQGWPKMAFIEERFEDDPTNWWAPNHAAVLAMLRSAGMRVVSRPAHEIYIAEPDPRNPGCAAGWNREEFLAAAGATRRSREESAASATSRPPGRRSS